MRTSKFDKFVDSILKPISPTLIISLALYTLIWGIWVALPFWSIFSHAQLFSVLGAFPPQYSEVFWGGIAIVLGLTSVRAAWHRHGTPVEWSAILLSAFWMTISVFYFVGDWSSTGGFTALLLASQAAYIKVNIHINRKIVSRDARLFSD